MMLLERLLRPALPWAMLESGVNRRDAASTSGGKEIARGTSREDTLAVLSGYRGDPGGNSDKKSTTQVTGREGRDRKRVAEKRWTGGEATRESKLAEWKLMFAWRGGDLEDDRRRCWSRERVSVLPEQG